MNTSENINELATALAKCQGEITFASKDSLNPHFKSRYADLADVWSACRQALTKNNLSVTQITEYIDGQLVLTSLLMHSSGQWIKSIYPIITARQDSQAYGAAITYARRYTLAALVGVAQDDDDAESTMIRNKPVQKQVTKRIDQAQIEQFITEFDLKNTETEMYKYIDFAAKKRNIDFKDMLEVCCLNKKDFLEAFEKSRAKQNEQ